jgi:pimeloyl-ACP methyl ester carboxylesterase
VATELFQRISLARRLAIAVFACAWPAIVAAQGSDLIPEASRAVSASRGGRVVSFTIRSEILQETRLIHIVLPASFDQSARDRTYPVIVVLDGEDNVPPIAAVSDELSHNGQIPESIIVAIPNTVRIRDLTPPGLSVSGSGLNGGGDRFLDFIERELLPAVDRQFRGAPPRTLVGHSSGGILATYSAATRPVFRAVVAIDTPTELGDDWLPKKLIARAHASAGMLRYASYESRFGWRDDTWQSLVASAPATWIVHRERLPGESHESIGMLAMYLGFREVFRDYSMLSAPATPTTNVLPYYAEVGRTFGESLVPPRKLLTHVVEDLLAEARGAAARDAYAMLVHAYGDPPDGGALKARIFESEHLATPTETVEALLATPFPTPEEARGFLGEWEGDIWMGSDEPRTGQTRLRIAVLNGRVVGETVRHAPDGSEDVQPWQYMRITPHGLTFGRLNGMRPRGVALFEGTLRGDTLAGTMRFGGIDFKELNGSAPPPLFFSFVRRR